MLPTLLPGAKPTINLLLFLVRRNISIHTQSIVVHSGFEPVNTYCILCFHIAQLYQIDTLITTFSANIHIKTI